MLTKITLNNFKSFKNKVTVDLMKTNYTILPQNVADNGVLKGCIFVGANASGKSNIILSGEKYQFGNVPLYIRREQLLFP